MSADRELSLFNLQRPEVIMDPHPLYRAMREHAHVRWDRYVSTWVVTGFAEVSTILKDRERFSVVMNHTERLTQYAPPEVAGVFGHLDRLVSFVDSPAHKRIRKPMATPFRHSMISGLRGRIDQIIDDALDAVAPSGRMDVVTDLGFPLPLRVIAELLGLTTVELTQLRSWSNVFGDIVASVGHIPDNAASLAEAVEDFAEYLREVVADHRAHPRADVTTSLVAAVDNGSMTEDELVANMMILITGGHETTTNLISSAMATMLSRPELANRLRDEPGLVATATEEFLRHDSPTQYTARTATEDVEVGGVTVRQGQSLVLMLAAANRDPAVFDHAEELILDRADARHVAFGDGMHVCFGAPLARVEAHAALTALTTRVQGARILGEPTWRLNGNLRGLASLPMEFEKIT